MNVETFECQETMAEPIEACEEAVRLIEEMQLDGQLALVKPHAEESLATRCPYRKIRADESFVYHKLCPRETLLKTFSECPIPLRVLQIAAHAQSLNMFEELWVWSAEGQVKDPVLVAYTNGRYKHPTDCFILARWGDVLDEWPVLVRKAMDLWRALVRSKFIKIKAEVAAHESTVDSMSLEDAIPHADGPWYGSW